jgi:hypothetical protein
VAIGVTLLAAAKKSHACSHCFHSGMSLFVPF